LSYGYDVVATGHYAQIRNINGTKELLRGIDPEKDQSYFLSALTAQQLDQAIFPIGHLHKSAVRDIARDA
jgi:tRNA-specific 2-thiouridylase